MAFAEDHPARQALIAHAVCRRDCVGREIIWPGSEHLAIDIEWWSLIEGKRKTFSGFMYQYVSFDLVLQEWIDRPQQVTESERRTLHYLANLKSLLAECESAARAAANERILELVPIVRKFFDLWEQSVRYRIQQDKLTIGDDSLDADGF
ncbi:MAG: hypothetical protein ACKVP0_20015 [Pirellulaceae bacterium]